MKKHAFKRNLLVVAFLFFKHYRLGRDKELEKVKELIKEDMKHGS